jgi:hypothetical protein
MRGRGGRNPSEKKSWSIDLLMPKATIQSLSGGEGMHGLSILFADSKSEILFSSQAWFRALLSSDDILMYMETLDPSFWFRIFVDRRCP